MPEAAATVQFPRPVRVEQLAFRHLLEGRPFFGHARVERIEFTDGADVNVIDRLDEPGKQVIDIEPLDGRSLALRIVDTDFTGASNNGLPVDELALVGIVFVGTGSNQGG